MSNTIRANAPASSIDRRAALGAIAAASALLAVPCLAKASSDDAEVFATIQRLEDAHRAQSAIGEAMDNLEHQLPSRWNFPALIARPEDQAFFRTRTEVGWPLDSSAADVARRQMVIYKLVGIPADDPVFGAASVRAAEVCRADDEYKRARDEAVERLKIDEAKKVYGDAVDVTCAIADELIAMRPRTHGGLRAIVTALLGAGMFDDTDKGTALARLVIEAPALTVEA